MAWAIIFDGVNDYMTINLPAAVNSSGFEANYNFRWKKISGDSYIIGNSSVEFIRITGSLFQVFASSVKVAEWDLSSYTLTDFNDYSLMFFWDGATSTRTWKLSVNAIPETDVVASNTSRFGLITQLGRRQASIYTGEAQLEYFTYDDTNSVANSRDWDATSSFHGAGTPILDDILNGFDATGVNMPTDGSAWIDLGGGGITVTADSQDYNVNFYDGIVSLTGEIAVTGESQTHNVTFYDATIDLTGEVLVNAEYQNYQVQFFDAQVSLISGIEVQAQSQDYDVTFFDASVQLSGEINVSAESQNYSVTFYDATVSITELWTDKPKAVTNWTNQAQTVTIWTDK